MYVCCVALRICSNAFRVLLLHERPVDGKANFFGCVLADSISLVLLRPEEGPGESKATDRPSRPLPPTSLRKASCEFRRCLALFSETVLKFKSDPYVTKIGNTIRSYIDHKGIVKMMKTNFE